MFKQLTHMGSVFYGRTESLLSRYAAFDIVPLKLKLGVQLLMTNCRYYIPIEKLDVHIHDKWL